MIYINNHVPIASMGILALKQGTKTVQVNAGKIL